MNAASLRRLAPANAEDSGTLHSAIATTAKERDDEQPIPGDMLPLRIHWGILRSRSIILRRNNYMETDMSMSPERIAELERYGYDSERWTLAARKEVLEAYQALQQELGNILAIIHRDGGHHTMEVGWTQSVKDAHQVWATLQQELQTLRKRHIEVVLELAKLSTAEQRERLRQSEHVPAEIWNMRLD